MILSSQMEIRNSQSLSLQQTQTVDVLKEMFSLSSPPNDASSSSPPSSHIPSSTWKILIYDRTGQDILAPLFTVNILRSLGVTLNMLIDKPREKISDVPAIYFIQPTEENIQKISDDVHNNLYDYFYINFTSSISRELLENLAHNMVKNNTISSIRQIYDQYCEFITLEHHLFTLSIPSCYSLLHHPTAEEEQILKIIDRIVSNLLSVCVTLGSIPIIRYPETMGPAHMVGKKLTDKLRTHLSDNLFVDRNSSFSSLSSFSSRPLLILLDRDFDLSITLHHPWTYQGLLHDIFGLSQNIIYVPDPQNPQSFIRYDIDVNDDFWQSNANKTFQEVTQNIQNELDHYQSSLKHINETTGLEIDLSDPHISLHQQGLSKVIDSLPSLQKQKKRIDMHTNIATHLLNHLKERELDQYYTIEEQIMTKQHYNHQQMKKYFLSDNNSSTDDSKKEGKGNLEDKIRLFLISFLSDLFNPEEIKEYQQILLKEGANLSSFEHLQHLKLKSLSTNLNLNESNSLNKKKNKNDVSQSQPSSSTTNFLYQVASTVVESGKTVLKGIKNIMPLDTKLPVTKLVESFIDNNTTPLSSKYLYIDPLHLKKDKLHSSPSISFNQCIVFFIGGGSYPEYLNIKEHISHSSNTNPQSDNITIHYGCTNILRPIEILQELQNMNVSS